jgi:hypothetical protein
MIRRCAWCKTDLGEICKNCGCTDVSVTAMNLTAPDKSKLPLFVLDSTREAPHYSPAIICVCNRCQANWLRGQDGTSHGMCKDCEKKENAKLMN